MHFKAAMQPQVSAFIFAVHALVAFRVVWSFKRLATPFLGPPQKLVSLRARILT